MTTNSVRGGASRRVLDPIADANALMEAWADEPWAVKGAAVRVSMFGFGRGFVDRRLEGHPSERINADFTGAGVDVTRAQRIRSNAGIAFQGPVLIGPFQVPGTTARSWLAEPTNPNGRRNSDVLEPIINATDVVRRYADDWVVDFGHRSEGEASMYEGPFEYVRDTVRPIRINNRRAWRAEQWWRHGEAGDGWRAAVSTLSRFIVTPRVAKHRVFAFALPPTLPDSRLFAIARDDFTSFGILHSHFHELWSLATCSWHGVGNDPTYNNRSCFETFPFPEGLTPAIPASDYADDARAAAIAEAAAELNRLREAWLNPPDLVRTEPEVDPGYPDRILPRDEAAAKVLKSRTLTNLYNQRPAWLDMAHRRLDAAAAAAYGWPADLTDEDILARLFALNQEPASAAAQAPC